MDQNIPTINLKALWQPQTPERLTKINLIADEIDKACINVGFFVVQNHQIPKNIFDKVHKLSLQFFHLSHQQKQKIQMSKGKKAWRGWFPLGGQLTSGKPDGKQGLYFGTENLPGDPRPLHGANLFPDQAISEMRETILQYITQLTKLGHTLMRCIARALKLPEKFFQQKITEDPTILFRIFHYPPNPTFQFGVQEHTDYGLITLLCIDDSGGLQVKTPQGKWIDAPCPQSGQYFMIINLGDMLQKMSQGRYISTPHRVKNIYKKERISFPLFFDPSWNAKVCKIPFSEQQIKQHQRWDGVNLSAWQGQYGTYLTDKVSKCFPELFGSYVHAQQQN